MQAPSSAISSHWHDEEARTLLLMATSLKLWSFSSLKNYTNNFWPSVYYQFQNQLTINITISKILQNVTMGMSKRQSLATCASSVAWMARFSPISPKYLYEMHEAHVTIIFKSTSKLNVMKLKQCSPRNFEKSTTPYATFWTSNSSQFNTFCQKTCIETSYGNLEMILNTVSWMIAH